MQSCGAEVADDAEVPERLAELMAHVAENMDAHAHWVGTTTPEAAAEHAGLSRLARDYRAISAAAQCAAETMRGMRDLPPAPHDPARLDRPAFELWMRKKIELQRAFAQLVLSHAAVSEQALLE